MHTIQKMRPALACAGLGSSVTTAVLLLAAQTVASGAPLKVTPTTPAGITLVEVVRDEGGGQPVLLWYRPGDEAGRTLFEFDQDRPGISNCHDACAQEFRPLAVSSGAKAFGDWSIVRRADGARQWAYLSHPLYVWIKEKIPERLRPMSG